MIVIGLSLDRLSGNVTINTEKGAEYGCNPGSFGTKANIGKIAGAVNLAATYQYYPIDLAELTKLKMALSLYMPRTAEDEQLKNIVLGVMSVEYGINI